MSTRDLLPQCLQLRRADPLGSRPRHDRRLEDDPFDRSVYRLAFLEAATVLPYVYIGFSELVRTAWRVSTLG